MVSFDVNNWNLDNWRGVQSFSALCDLCTNFVLLLWINLQKVLLFGLAVVAMAMGDVSHLSPYNYPKPSPVFEEQKPLPLPPPPQPQVSVMFVLDPWLDSWMSCKHI